MGFSRQQVEQFQRNLAASAGEAAPVRRRKPAAKQKRIPPFMFVCQSLKIPLPEFEHRFDPKRRWRLDYCWPEHKLALEVEGAVWVNGRHTRGSGFVKDMEKYNALALAGYRLIRCQPKQLEAAETIEMIRRALGIIK